MRQRDRLPWVLAAVLVAGMAGSEVQAQEDSSLPPLPPPIADEPRPPISGPAAPSPTAPSVNVSTAREEDEPPGLPINLATAMQLAGVTPLDIEAAIARVQQSLAVQLQARVLWVPSINGGVDYYRHDGFQQDFLNGTMFRKGLQTFFVGGGPSLNVGLTDAIFTPLAAHRVVAARRADLQAARNDVLLQVAQAYFLLQDARGRLLGIDATLVQAERLVNFTEGLAPALIAPLEINRARAELQSLLQARQVALRDWRVASARLAEVLLLDPAALLQPIEPPFLAITLIPGDPTSDQLTMIALHNRPEIASQSELLAAATQLLRQEKARPLLPSLIVRGPASGTGLLAAGNISGGANGFLGDPQSRADFEVAAVWELQNAGIGNIGRIKQRRAEQETSSIELRKTFFRVRSEVSQALARLLTARARVPQTEEGLRQAIASADKNFEGLRETARPAGELLRLVVRPQEVVAAIIALNIAYQEYATAVNEYNTAQFDLYHALGQPAQWVTAQSTFPPPPPEAAPAPMPVNTRGPAQPRPSRRPR
jgi:outer membrane protein TolC